MHDLESNKVAIFRPDYFKGVVAWLLLIEGDRFAISLSDLELFNQDLVLLCDCNQIREGVIEAAWVKRKCLVANILVLKDRLNFVSNIS